MVKFKYIIIKEIPYNKGITVAQVNVSALNKKESYKKWDELEKIFTRDKYQSSLTECGQEMREFMNIDSITKTVDSDTEQK